MQHFLKHLGCTSRYSTVPPYKNILIDQYQVQVGMNNYNRIGTVVWYFLSMLIIFPLFIPKTEEEGFVVKRHGTTVFYHYCTASVLLNKLRRIWIEVKGCIKKIIISADKKKGSQIRIPEKKIDTQCTWCLSYHMPTLIFKTRQGSLKLGPTLKRVVELWYYFVFRESWSVKKVVKAHGYSCGCGPLSILDLYHLLCTAWETMAPMEQKLKKPINHVPKYS